MFREEEAMMLTMTDDIVESREEGTPMDLLNVAEEVSQERNNPAAHPVPIGSRGGAGFDIHSGFYPRHTGIPFSPDFMDDPELMQAIQASLLD